MKLEEAMKVSSMLRGMGYTDVKIGYTRQWGYVVTGCAPGNGMRLFGGSSVYEWCLEHPERNLVHG